MSNDHLVCSVGNRLCMWVMGEKLEGRNKEISKEAIRITQVRENDGLNQGDSSTDSRNALGHR